MQYGNNFLSKLPPETAAAISIGILVLFIWSFIWKGIALWKAGRNNQLGWYVFMLILNTAGILEILYLLFFQKKSQA